MTPERVINELSQVVNSREQVLDNGKAMICVPIFFVVQ